MVADLNCRDCKHWRADMDMDPYCMSHKAKEERGPFGATLVGANNFRVNVCKFELFEKFEYSKAENFTSGMFPAFYNE